MSIEIRVNNYGSIIRSIRERYAILFPAVYTGKHKEIADVYLPSVICGNNPTLHKNMIALSRRTAEELDVDMISDNDLLKIIDVTKTEIKKVFSEVKKKDIGLVSIGYGGSSSNILYWIYTLARIADMHDIFNFVSIHDEDIIEPHNLLRIPFINNKIAQRDYMNKVLYYNEKLFDRRLGKSHINASFFKPNKKLKEMKNIVIFGAPDIETRKKIDELNITWYAITHQDNEIQITETPSFSDSDPITEGYGVINLGCLLINHLYAAWIFIKGIADGEIKCTTEPPEKNTLIFKNNFDDKGYIELTRNIKLNAFCHKETIEFSIEKEADIEEIINRYIEI